MANTNVVDNGLRSNKLEAGDQVGRARTPITRVLGSSSPVELLAEEHFEDYLLYASSRPHPVLTVLACDQTFVGPHFTVIVSRHRNASHRNVNHRNVNLTE